MRKDKIKRMLAFIMAFFVLGATLFATPATVKADEPAYAGEIEIALPYWTEHNAQIIPMLLFNTMLPEDIRNNYSSASFMPPATSELEFDINHVVPIYNYSYMDNALGQSVYSGFATEEEIQAVKALFDENGKMIYNGSEVSLICPAQPDGFIFKSEGIHKIVMPRLLAVSKETGEQVYFKLTIQYKAMDKSKNKINDTKSVLPEGAGVGSEVVSSGTVYDSAMNTVSESVEEVKSASIYEMNCYNANCTQQYTQLTDYIDVTLDAPFAITDADNVRTFRIEGDELIECPTVVSNGKITFTTNHFSTYAFIEEAAVVDNPPADNPPVDNPPVDNPPVDNPPVDNPPIDNPPIDNPPVDNPPVDNPPIDNPPVYNPPVDNPPVDTPSVDNPPVDNAPADNPPIDNPSVDNAPADNPTIDNSSEDSAPADNAPVDNPSVDNAPVDNPPANDVITDAMIQDENVTSSKTGDAEYLIYVIIVLVAVCAGVILKWNKKRKGNP